MKARQLLTRFSEDRNLVEELSKSVSDNSDMAALMIAKALNNVAAAILVSANIREGQNVEAT